MSDADSSRLAMVISALDHPTRRRIIATLLDGDRHVSAMARELGVSRPVVHVHLGKLQAAGLATSRLEFSADGKALRRYMLTRFHIPLTPEVVAEAAAADHYRTQKDE